MSVKQFTSSDNIKLLWDIVSDEDVFLFLDKNRQASMYELFLNNIKGFYEAEKNRTPNLVEINKKYISLIMTHINKNYNLNKIKIHHDYTDNNYNNNNNNNNIINNNKELITVEEIQNGRRSKFERDWIQKQQEFEESITLKTPPVPEFADKQMDTPIQDLDKKLKEIQNQRKYDIEQTYNYNNNNSNNNNNNNSSNSINNNSWLTPQETSVKEQKKSVSFQDEQHKEFNIFSKLKFKESTTSVPTENNDISLERKVDILLEKVDAILQILSSK